MAYRGRVTLCPDLPRTPKNLVRFAFPLESREFLSNIDRKLLRRRSRFVTAFLCDDTQIRGERETRTTRWTQIKDGTTGKVRLRVVVGS